MAHLSRQRGAFQGYRELTRRYGSAFACRIETEGAEVEGVCLTAGDWRLVGLQAADDLERKNDFDAVLDYEPQRQQPGAKRSPTPARVRVETGDNPLKNGHVLKAYLEITGTAVSDSGRFRCPVPQHEDVHPSAQLWADGRWKCWSCGERGDVVDVAGVVTGRTPNGPDYRWLRDHVVDRLMRAPLPSERGPR
jgi:hypothetical protein